MKHVIVTAADNNKTVIRNQSLAVSFIIILWEKCKSHGRETLVLNQFSEQSSLERFRMILNTLFSSLSVLILFLIW